MRGNTTTTRLCSFSSSAHLTLTLFVLAVACYVRAAHQPPPHNDQLQMRSFDQAIHLDADAQQATDQAHQARLSASQLRAGDAADLQKRGLLTTTSQASDLKVSQVEMLPMVSGEPHLLEAAFGIAELPELNDYVGKPSSRRGQKHLHMRRAKSKGVVAVNEVKLHQDLEEGLDELSKSAADLTGQDRDLSKLVNPFIGSEGNYNPGNVCPGASVPFGMLKFNVDVDQYAPAGYVTNVDGDIRGLSPLHDSGTGSSAGSFGNFESMPIVCPANDFQKCPTRLDDRKRRRQAGKDEASPGYFSLTLNNSIKMEAAATRRAGLIRYTFPSSVLNGGKLDPHVVQDWTNDLPGTFRGGDITFDVDKGQIRMNGSWASSFGVGLNTYRAFSCIDVLNNGKQVIRKAGLWQGDRFGQDTKLEIKSGSKSANLTRNSIGGQPVQAGALYSFEKFPKTSDGSAEITLRVGISFNSAEQACVNAVEEVGDAWDFDAVVKQTRAAWNVKLNRFQIDPKTDKTIAELFYSSLYYSFLTPNNATQEAGNLYAGAAEDKYDGNYYNSLYCTWDTYRTFHPFLSLSSPVDMAEIVDNYIDGWRKEGWIPECRANNVPGLTQGGSHGVMVIADFLAKYHQFAKDGRLPVSIKDAYDAVYKDAYVTPADWNSYGRQISVYEQYGYIPFAVFDTYSTGRQTRECSRGLEYAHNDFGARTVALIAGHDDVAQDLANRSLTYKNNFDPSVTSFGFSNFVQKRYPDGTFHYDDPIICSPIDKGENRACSLPQENVWGVYETSSWEYSLYAPWDEAGLIALISNGSAQNFHDRLDAFFDKDLYYAGNEPSFSTPVSYHYINRPTSSVSRVREVVYQNFNVTVGGLPGNSDQGAMQTLLLFHLLGLYPVPATKELLILSPFLPSYKIRNQVLGDVHVKVTNFDPRSLAAKIPDGASAYVDKVIINGQEKSSRCRIDFYEFFPGEANKVNEVEIILTADVKRVDNCGPNGKDDLPSSLSTGGFAKF